MNACGEYDLCLIIRDKLRADARTELHVFVVSTQNNLRHRVVRIHALVNYGILASEQAARLIRQQRRNRTAERRSP